jgi:hypothetical protein
MGKHPPSLSLVRFLNLGMRQMTETMEGRRMEKFSENEIKNKVHK